MYRHASNGSAGPVTPTEHRLTFSKPTLGSLDVLSADKIGIEVDSVLWCPVVLALLLRGSVQPRLYGTRQYRIYPRCLKVYDQPVRLREPLSTTPRGASPDRREGLQAAPAPRFRSDFSFGVASPRPFRGFAVRMVLTHETGFSIFRVRHSIY